MPSKFILRNVNSGKEYKILKPSILIGRSPSCEIPTSRGYPSREHARLVQRRDGLYAEDLHSTNGTYVNNRRISSATALQEGDVVTIGGESFVLATQLNPDVTVVTGKLTHDTSDDACILIAEEDDVDATQVREPFPLPKGWNLSHAKDSFTRSEPSKSRYEINQLINKAAAAHGEVYSAAIVIFLSDAQPVICGLSLEQGQAQWSFGRGQECSFAINDPCISECHAVLRYRDGQWCLADNRSTNGLRIGERPCQEILLKDGLTFHFGRLKALFRLVKMV